MNSDYKKLVETYTEVNLNRITSKLILAYKTKNRSLLRAVATIVNNYLTIPKGDTGRTFNALIQLYHPDRLQLIKNDLGKIIQNGNFQELQKYAHVFETLKYLDGGKLPLQIPDPRDYSFDIEYGFDVSDFEDLNIEDDSIEHDLPGTDSGWEEHPSDDFLNILSEREGRNFGVDISLQTLENLTGELDLSETGIAELSGIEFCSNISSLNLSANGLIDIIELGHLTLLEELILSQNSIDSIECLSTLLNLRILDLSFNDISDISAILDLTKLEYVNLVGNPVKQMQIKHLKTNGVLVIV